MQNCDRLGWGVSWMGLRKRVRGSRDEEEKTDGVLEDTGRATLGDISELHHMTESTDVADDRGCAAREPRTTRQRQLAVPGSAVLERRFGDPLRNRNTTRSC